MKHLVIMAAGTGGHIFPGLAIAQTMRSRGWTVSWLGTEQGMEKEIVAGKGIEMDAINFSGVRGRGLIHSFVGVFRLLAGFVSCMKIFNRRNPNIVLGMGGYVTVPGGWAAKRHEIPLVLINADAALLLSNKALVSSAKKILFGFHGDFGAASAKAEVTGNPVRREILSVPSPEERFRGRKGPLRIFVVGGSLGARVLNETLPRALSLIPKDKRPIVVHQSGKQHIEDLQARYETASVNAEVLDFVEDMDRRYAEADLVICRAGAITVSELTVAGVASVLVPLVVSSTSHQKFNAQLMANNKAAIHMPQENFNPERLAHLLINMTRTRCFEMAMAARQLGQRHANDRIADVLESLSDSDG